MRAGAASLAICMPQMPRAAQTWPQSEQTQDGRPFAIRPIRIEDAQRDRDFLMHLSDDSRYKRMMGVCREPSAELIDRFVRVDRHRSMAFVAVVGHGDAEVIIGAVRYATLPSGQEAEFAIAVADDWQSCGVGSALLQTLIDYARSQGLRRLQGQVLANNRRMLEFARKHAFLLHPVPGEYTLVEITRDL